jgi:hypothetical protein
MPSLSARSTRNKAVFKFAAVDDRFAGFNISCAPAGLTFRRCPDQRLNGVSGVKGPREAAFDPPGHLGHPGDETGRQSAAGVAECAQAVHDGLFKTRIPGKFGIDVKIKIIAG